MKIISVVAIPPMNDGDWHDPPLKWAVNGPGTEVQHFATKADAQVVRPVPPPHGQRERGHAPVAT